ncbi:MAG: hypothetical protein AAGA38_11645 [Pseudomonadota bacterium]
MEPAFRFAKQARTPALFAGVVVTLGLVWLGLVYSAPLFIWFIWLPCLAALLWYVVTNPVAGLEITDKDLTAFRGKKSWRFDLARLAKVELRHDSDGPDTIVLHFLDGSTESLSLLASPPVAPLRQALARLGIQLQETSA